jgi:predicted dienelactone hydrolase
MRSLALWLILLAALDVACADDTVFKVGVTTRDLIPAEPYDWRGAKTHALRAMIWYPAAAEARGEAQWIGPPILPFYSAGSAARDAPHAAGPRHPLIILSHGFGGTASDLAWLCTALAAHGFIAVAVNHPGNNALEAYTVEGYSLMWLRAVDLSAAIDAVLDDKPSIIGSILLASAPPVIRSAATPSSRPPAASQIQQGSRRSAAQLQLTHCVLRRRTFQTCGKRAWRA